MNHLLSRRLLPAVLCSLACIAIAQPAAPASAPRRADPLDARTPVPPVRYTPLLAPARKPLDVPPVPWREANDTTARIGGWKAYAREAQAPESKP